MCLSRENSKIMDDDQFSQYGSRPKPMWPQYNKNGVGQFQSEGMEKKQSNELYFSTPIMDYEFPESES